MRFFSIFREYYRLTTWASADTNSLDYRVAICESRRLAGTHGRTYNAPTVHEVAVLMPNDAVSQHVKILHTRSNQLQKISELPRACDTLQYPLLMPCSTDGGSLELKLTSRYKLTQLQYHCFHFFTRMGNFIPQTPTLLKQFMVDACAKIESEHLISEERARSPKGRWSQRYPLMVDRACKKSSISPSINPGHHSQSSWKP